MKISHYYPHSGGILGCHANVDFQHTNYLLNVTICEKLRCVHNLQTISDAFSHIASRFVKVALAIKFALNWLAGPQCAGPAQRQRPPGRGGPVVTLSPGHVTLSPGARPAGERSRPADGRAVSRAANGRKERFPLSSHRTVQAPLCGILQDSTHVI